MSNDRLVLLLDHSTIPLACLGHLDQSWSRADAALAEARRLAQPHTLVDALAWAWITGWCIGSKPESLLQYAEEMLALSAEHEFELYRSAGALARGWCLAALGHADGGIPLLTTGLAGMRDAGFTLHTPFWLTLLADAFRMAGQWHAALGHLAEARRFAEETGDRWALAEALRLRGEVLAFGDPAAAEASYGEALALAQQQSAKLWELRAAISLARMWRDQGKPTEARDLLAPVYDWFTEGFATRVLQDAKTLLDELGANSGLVSGGA
jgi:predicted ATPase